MVITTRFVKSVVPESHIVKLKQVKFNLEKVLLIIFGSSKITSNLYYAFFSMAFAREHQSVLKGRARYINLLENNVDSSYLVRRNIHRLEKALIMKPRREIFAADYIEETLKGYSNLLKAKHGNSDDEELKWAYDVLNKYFNVVKSESRIDKARNKFYSLNFIKTGNNRVPYKRNLNNNSVTYEDFLKLCWQRRSVRWYLNKKVPRELIDKAITAASLSPSACNRQPFEFRIFDEFEMVQKVSSIAQGTKGFNHNFPLIIAVIGKLSAYFSERDRHIIYIDSSLASMSLMFALESMGLSSCSINWPEIESWDLEIAHLINLEPDERVVMLLSVGYPDPNGMVPYSQKKSLNKIRKYN